MQLLLWQGIATKLFEDMKLNVFLLVVRKCEEVLSWPFLERQPIESKKRNWECIVTSSEKQKWEELITEC